jgi:hypothetical protein
MHIGLFALLGNPFGTPDYVHALGTAAEERGFHSLWVAEHVVLFDDYVSLETLDRLLAARGRSRRDVHLSVCPYFGPADLDLVKRYRDVGVDQVILILIAPRAEELRRSLDRLAETIVEPARRL